MCGIAGIVESGLPPDKLRSRLDRNRGASQDSDGVRGRLAGL